MYIHPSLLALSSTSSNIVHRMHPPLTTTTSSNNTIHLSQEHRTRLYQIINELNDDQLRLFLTNHLQSISNTTLNNQFQHYSRTQLVQQSYILIDSYYSIDLEQTLYTMRQKRFPADYPQQQQQQQQIYRAPQQPQQNYPTSYNQQSYYYTPQTVQYNAQSNYRFPSPSNASQQLRQIRPNTSSAQTNNVHNHPPQNFRAQQQQQSSYLSSVLPRQQYIRHSAAAAAAPPPPISSNGSSTSTAIPRYQVPTLPPPPASSNITRPILSTPSSTRNIIHKTLPFYRPLTCVYECYQAFRYDAYRKQYFSRSDMLLSLDVCNQLSLSYDYDSDLDIHKTSKCLIMRLARIDQPAMSNGKYDDNLPPNLLIQINSQNLTNLPTPKPCTRQQTDLIRIGREIDITSYCMFNPSLNNEIAMSWSYRQDNTTLHSQYANAQYALHIFLVQHMAIEELCEQIRHKLSRFYREDLVKLLAKSIANDRDLGLEVSDQKLKLKCPIDQRRLKIPIRAITCQHLQCFDLTNYIALNEKAGKWICPVCNKPALYDDLQIDSYTESILNSIDNENITEISIDSELRWKPVTSSITTEPQQITSYIDDIILDDDQNEQQSDTKSNIQLIPSTMPELSDVILIDDD